MNLNIHDRVKKNKENNKEIIKKSWKREKIIETKGIG